MRNSADRVQSSPRRRISAKIMSKRDPVVRDASLRDAPHHEDRFVRPHPEGAAEGGVSKDRGRSLWSLAYLRAYARRRGPMNTVTVISHFARPLVIGSRFPRA